MWQKNLLGGLVAVLLALNIYQYRQPAPAAEEDPGPTPQEIFDLYHTAFYELPTTWLQNRWLGVPTQQNPNDVWITQEILTEVKPDVVVETGTHEGGSAALWAMVLSQVNPEARVITVDISPKVSDRARSLPIVEERVEFLVGSSTAPEIIAEIRQKTEGKKVLVILDSDHSMAHVQKELELYSPIVSVGSYLIVQDTNINGHPVHPTFGPGPWEALDAWLPENDHFEVDTSRERLLFTMHPRGYLKRVR